MTKRCNPEGQAEKPVSEQERSRLTREALADVDEGRVIDHQTLQAWAESLSESPARPAPK